MMAETFTRSVWRTAIRRHFGQGRAALLPEANAALTQPLSDLGLTTEPLTWETLQRDAARLASDLGLLLYTGPMPFTQDQAARLDAIADFLAHGGVFVLLPTCASGQDDLLLTQLTFLQVDGSLLPAATAATHSLRPRLPLSALIKAPVACQAASPLLLMTTEDDRGIFLTVHASSTGPSLGAAAGLVIHHRGDAGAPGVLAVASAPALTSVDPEALLAALCLGANHARRGPDAEPLE
jgi:hypothetical protein